MWYHLKVESPPPPPRKFCSHSLHGRGRQGRSLLELGVEWACCVWNCYKNGNLFWCQIFIKTLTNRMYWYIGPSTDLWTHSSDYNLHTYTSQVSKMCGFFIGQFSMYIMISFLWKIKWTNRHSKQYWRIDIVHSKYCWNYASSSFLYFLTFLQQNVLTVNKTKE